MKLREALDEKKLDLRVRDRLLAEGKLTQKELQDYFSNTPDDEGKFEVIQSEE